MTFLLLAALSFSAWTQPLEMIGVQYRTPSKAASCGLLRQREKERVRVIRELSHLTRKSRAIRQDSETAASYNYWLRKLFMPSEDWIETSTEVVLTVHPQEDLRARIATEGLGAVFLITRGPGFVWQSFGDQLPPEMSISLEGEILVIRYFTFLNVVCDPALQPLSVEWVTDPDQLI